MYTITLSDGTKLTNLNLNGNNYISNEPIEDSIFEGNLDTVTITDGKITDTYKDMVLLSNRIESDGKGWFVLGVKSERKKRDENILAELQEMKQAISMFLKGGGELV